MPALPRFSGRHHLSRFPLLLVAVAGLGFTACELPSLSTPRSSTPMEDASLRGQVHLSLELQRTLQSTAALYIMARRPGEPTSLPFAVKRYSSPLRFPIDFAITARDTMLPGRTFSGNFTLMARVSQSGAATPVGPGDIEGFANAKYMPVGADHIRIELNQVRR